MNKLLLLSIMLLTITLPAFAFSAQGAAGGNNTPNSISVHSSSDVKVGQIVRDCAQCPEMVAVPQVGRPASDPGKIFYVGRFEVTWREYLIAVQEGSCPVPEKDFGGTYDASDRKINDYYPITGISPDIFRCYLKWIKNKTGKEYRIPSAKEWEHAARSGTKSEYYWGDGIGYNNAIVFDYFNYKELQRKLGESMSSMRDDLRGDVKWKAIYPVGQFKPNSWGLYDIIGNAAEITTEPYSPSLGCIKIRSTKACEMLSARGNVIVRLVNPMKPNPPITESLTTTRYPTSAHHGYNRVGFRLVRD